MPGKIHGLCLVCSVENALYRCPTCSLTYCSLTCYKQHQTDAKCISKTVKPIDELEKPIQNSAAPPLLSFTEEEEEKDRVKRTSLAELHKSKHLKNMLANKHLRAMLTEIDNSHQPGKNLESAMQIPIFTEFVDECMRIVDDNVTDT